MRFLAGLVITASVSCLGGFAAKGLAAPATAAGIHEDLRFGFQIRVPSKWTRWPPLRYEPWVVAKYCAPTFDLLRDRHFVYRQTLRLVAFVDPPSVREGPGGDRSTARRSVESRYSEYLAHAYSSGFEIISRDEGERAGLAVTRFEVHASPWHLTTWCFDLETGCVAVEFEVLEECRSRKVDNTFLKSLRSFKPIAAEAAMELDDWEFSELSFFHLRDLPPVERSRLRMENEERAWHRMTSDLPRGWSTLEIEDVKVITQLDRRKSIVIAQDLQGRIHWMNEMFGDMSAEEVPPKILWILDHDYDRRYLIRSRTFGSRESIVSKVTPGPPYSDITSYWFKAKDGALGFSTMPRWFIRGLFRMMASGDPLEVGAWEKTIRAEAFLSARDVMCMTRADSKELPIEQLRYQWVRLVRTMISEEYRPALVRYLRSVSSAIRERELLSSEQLQTSATWTYSRQIELFALRREALAPHEKAILESALAETFSQDDMAQLETDYALALDGD